MQRVNKYRGFTDSSLGQTLLNNHSSSLCHPVHCYFLSSFFPSFLPSFIHSFIHTFMHSCNWLNYRSSVWCICSTSFLVCRIDLCITIVSRSTATPRSIKSNIKRKGGRFKQKNKDSDNLENSSQNVTAMSA